MTVKTECVIKHLKHDYKEIGIAVGILVGFVAFVATIFYGGAYILASPVWTGENVLNTCAALLVFIFTIPILVWGDKQSLTITVPDTGDKSDRGYDVILLAAICAGTCIYGTYAVLVTHYGYPYFPWLSLFAYVVSIVIGIPIACAVARCRE